MTKTRKIALAIAAVVILALLVVAMATGGIGKMNPCTICHGDISTASACGICETEEFEACGKGKLYATLDGQQVIVDCTACEGTGHFCDNCENAGEVSGSFWALLPPVIAIALALITKEAYSSLFIGVLSGAILYATNAFSGIESFTGIFDTLTSDGMIAAASGTAGIFIFLVELGVIVALVNKSGGSAAFGRWAETHIKTKVGAALATFALGVLIFIDDYFNCLTVGSVMRPVTDRHKISRAKLSYLIDATAAPICMIAPISSWAAAVSQYADDGKGLKLFVSAIPFNFYSLLTIVFVIAMSCMAYDYGSMRIHEFNAEHKNDLFTSGERAKSEAPVVNERGRVIDLILPIVILVVVCVFALVYNGGILADDTDFITAFGNTDATVALPWGGFIALVVTIGYMILRKLTTFKDAMGCVPAGFIAMVPAILILTFATALKEVTSLLGAKYFIAALMDGAAAGLWSMLPAIIFVVACILAFATGTSWGTFGILIPIVTAIFANDPNLMTIGISACLAGAVCGDHCSPISDTTIMASAGAECDHLNHVSTQLPYAITVAVISFIMFILAGFIKNAWICLPIGIVLTVGFVVVMKLITKKRHPEYFEAPTEAAE